MHSRRTRTDRTLTYLGGGGGGVCLLGGGGGGGSASLVWSGVCLMGGGGGGLPAWWGGGGGASVLLCLEGQTDACENVTFSTLLCTAVGNKGNFLIHIRNGHHLSFCNTIVFQCKDIMEKNYISYFAVKIEFSFLLKYLGSFADLTRLPSIYFQHLFSYTL